MLVVKLSTLESWTGPLACDPILQARYPGDAEGHAHPIIKAYLESGNPADLGDLEGVCTVTVRPVDSRALVHAEAAAYDAEPSEGLARAYARFEAIARKGLVRLSDIPDVMRASGGYPIEALGSIEQYASLVAEVAAHCARLGRLPKGPNKPSAGQ